MTFCLFLREERRKFITAKYADKQFSLSDDEVDLGDELSLQSDSSNNEEIDQNILSEVRHFGLIITNILSILTWKCMYTGHL